MSSKAEKNLRQKDFHYSRKNTGHVLRSEHARIVKALRGDMPEGIPGFQGIDLNLLKTPRRAIYAYTNRIPVVAGGQVPPEFTHRANMDPHTPWLRRRHMKVA
jgi:hypothetical protein